MCEKNSLWCSYQSIFFKVAQHPVYPCFAILTAFNPRSIVLSNKRNLVRHRQLELSLRRQCGEILPVTCSGPDGQWQELGFVVPMTREAACREAARWGQNAIYWVEGNELFLVPVLLEGVQTQRLGDWPSFLYT
ncbi:DUF3293 domain-containing protein [Photobacterium lutimaris]|uniref:DUF3293 domain-containing protein n=1 Tax=Photobacterium lutimaris TaxID=388278 RepID=A0A2T3IU79_9GAMM|nr:DUF3293 domain-containing protein [Photobacterium lutimaris]PSU31930.1 DUF3293 domain-containing protein [Photobacterium lutimaris]TDR73462.1 uncharacterized protein DUF3293 [Photobacterium lutimaris]